MNQNGLRISELAEYVGGQLVGDGDRYVGRVSGLEEADEQSVVYIDSLKLLDRAAGSGAGCCITPPTDHEVPLPRIEIRNPKLAFARAAGVLHPPRRRAAGIHPSAIVAPTAHIDPGAHVGPHVHVEDGAEIGAGSQILAGAYVGAGVRVGAECVIHPHVVLYDGVVLGDRVVLHAGVVILDDVEVGVNTAIDRGSLGVTRVGRGTKIDNLVMVAHNVQIGERVVLVSQVGISGSSRIGDDAVLAGQVGVGDHVRIEERAQIGGKSGIFSGKIVPAGSVQMGIPARPIGEYKRVSAQANRLPQLRAEVRELRQEIDRLKAHLGIRPHEEGTEPGQAP